MCALSNIASKNSNKTFNRNKGKKLNLKLQRQIFYHTSLNKCLNNKLENKQEYRSFEKMYEFSIIDVQNRFPSPPNPAKVQVIDSFQVQMAYLHNMLNQNELK